jgi:hypothetical protein
MTSLNPTVPGVRGRGTTKDAIFLRTYALTEQPPTELYFSRHMLRFTGLKLFESQPDLVWGVHGTSSTNNADAFSSRDAQHLGRKLYQIDLMYKLQNPSSPGASVTQESVDNTGYMHISRLAKAYATKLKEMVIGWLEALDDPELPALKGMDFEELIRHRPMMVHKLMGDHAYIDCIIHTVFLAGGVRLRIGTVRNKPANILAVLTRFHDEIQTRV